MTNMDSLGKRKYMLPFFICIVIVLFANVLLFIPAFRELIIHFGEEYIVHRPLTHPIWHQRFIACGLLALFTAVYLILFFIFGDSAVYRWCSMLVFTFFVCMQSPLNPFVGGVPGTDSSVFLTIARGMLQGKTPYVDFFDHKGPLIYIIDALGLFIGGFTGVWLIELLLMYVSVLFAYKTARFFGGKTASLLGVMFMLTSLKRFFEGGNLTEEYALPFIFISLYIFTKYFFAGTEPNKILIVILGFCFGETLLLRPNMFALWASFCIVIFIKSINEKRFMDLFNYIIFFSVGVIGAIVPVFIYLWTKDAIASCIDQYIIFNYIYSTDDMNVFSFIMGFFRVCENTFFWVPVLLLFAAFEKSFKQKYSGFYAAYFISVILTICLIAVSRRNYPHYSMVMIPLFIPPLSFLFQKLTLHIQTFKIWFTKYIFWGIIHSLLAASLLTDFQTIFMFSHQKEKFSAIGKIINNNTNENDTMTVFGNTCSLYLFSNRVSVSKYIYQYPISSFVPEIAVRYQNDIHDKKPSIIIMPDDTKYEGSLNHAFFSIIDMLNSDGYATLYADDKYHVFKKP